MLTQHRRASDWVITVYAVGAAAVVPIGPTVAGAGTLPAGILLLGVVLGIWVGVTSLFSP